MIESSTIITAEKETYEAFIENKDASEDIFNYIGIMPGPQVNIILNIGDPIYRNWWLAKLAVPYILKKEVYIIIK